MKRPKMKLQSETPTWRMPEISTINSQSAMGDKKLNNRCRKCLQKHHTNVCKKPDGSTCDKCTRRHRALQNEEFVPANFSLNPQATPFVNSMQGASNHSMQGTSNVPGHWTERQASTLNVQPTRNSPVIVQFKRWRLQTRTETWLKPSLC